MTQIDIVRELAQHFSLENFEIFLRSVNPNFQPHRQDLSHYLQEDGRVSDLQKIGELNFSEVSRVLIAAARLQTELSTRTGKKAQYDLAKSIIKDERYDAGLFTFYDDQGCFRLSLIIAQYKGTRREFTNFRRYTFFVEPDLPNKTFITQLASAKFSSLQHMLEIFSIEAVSNEFYNQFNPHFQALQQAVQGSDNEEDCKAFALLLVMRIIFLGFVQKKGWIGHNRTFIQDFLREYQNHHAGQNTFYREWLAPLFFEALNHPPGYNAYANAPFSDATKRNLVMAPFLNGELFKRKSGVDDLGCYIPDQPIADFIDFLFQYNFTIEENDLYDEELELNPEFLGIIFERLVNKEDGAVYTPRTEVDLMCRLALVKWLERNNTSHIETHDLYNFMFRNLGSGDEFDADQKEGDFSANQIEDLIHLLRRVTVCDPAAGSGAFEVGMLQVLARQIENLYDRERTPAHLRDEKPTDFELKKDIIANSLYGVEVKRWAVWINHLRLWLTLFVDMPDDYKDSQLPLLPNLTFKVRVGDSLVQRVGSQTFPIQAVAGLPPAFRQRLDTLRKRKHDFFYNRSDDFNLIMQEELHFFQDMLNAQIDERRARIAQLLKPQLKQADWLDANKIEQLQLAGQEEVQQQRAVLEEQISQLRDQQNALMQERPLLWSLEFSEIFLERGGFDIIIGNPPYVRQEAIADPNGHLPVDEYKAALKEMLLLDYPAYFARSQGITHEFKPDRRPDGRSDLYTYFYMRSLRLINESGVHVFICSNSWLDVGYGAWLQEFLLRTTPIHFIIDNLAKRSFTTSDVNTIITVLGAPQAGAADNNQQVRFVAFKKPFEESVFAENLLQMQIAQEIEKMEDGRVFPIRITELLREGSLEEGEGANARLRYVGDKWGGKYLRAPDIYFTILEKGAGKLVRLGDIADVRRGITTGANDFFYLRPLGPGSRPGLLRVRNGAGWEGELEEEFLKPVIKSPRDSRTIRINPDELPFRIFMCQLNRDELAGILALRYIEWGERQEITIRQGRHAGQVVIGYQNIRSVQGRRNWWQLPDDNLGTCFWIKESNDRLSVFCSDTSLYADCRLYISQLPLKNILVMNSTLNLLLSETLIRSGLGLGARSLMVYEVKNSLIINSEFIDDDIMAHQDILDRRITSIFHECGINPESDISIDEQIPSPLIDRAMLDEIVFPALNLTSEERVEIYQEICKLVWSRLSRAQNF